MIIRAKTFEKWMLANLKDYMPDIVEHGCSGGFPGLTYYRDTCKLYNRFKDEIWDAVVEDADAFGMQPLEFVASFNGSDVGDVVQFENLMTWYMAERVARQVIEEY